MLIMCFILTSSNIAEIHHVYPRAPHISRNPFNSPWGYSYHNWRIMVLKGSSIKLWWFCEMPFLTPRDGSVLGNNFLEVIWWCWRHKEHLSLGSSFQHLSLPLWLHHFSALVSKLYDYSQLQAYDCFRRENSRNWLCFTVLIIFPPSTAITKIIEFLLLLGISQGNKEV